MSSEWIAYREYDWDAADGSGRVDRSYLTNNGVTRTPDEATGFPTKSEALAALREQFPRRTADVRRGAVRRDSL